MKLLSLKLARWVRCMVRSTTSYAYEVWVDSKKIKAIEVVYIPRVFQVLAHGAKNNQHVHRVGRIWQIHFP